jgi:hypothetical protein
VLQALLSFLISQMQSSLNQLSNRNKELVLTTQVNVLSFKAKVVLELAAK